MIPLSSVGFNESKHPRDSDGKWNAGGDTAVINIPLAKRGDINAQLDKYKAEQTKLSSLAAKDASQKKKTDKAQAKEIFASHGQEMIERFAPKFGKQNITDILDQMVKWEPKKFLAFAEKHKAETAAK